MAAGKGHVWVIKHSADKMKSLIIIFAASVIVGCSKPTTSAQSTSIAAHAAKAIIVGNYVDPFERDPIFTEYFRIDDTNTVANLTDVIKQPRSIIRPPFIGILAYQRFVDAQGRVLAETHIVNFDNAVIVSGPEIDGDGFRSKVFCRKIYDLMLQHCPEKIEAQRIMYKESNQNLESLLFEGRETNSTAQPTAAASPTLSK